MTKVYLVCSQSCTQHGVIELNSRKNVVEVFTNRKLAEKCMEYMNQEWKIAFGRNADFKAERIKFYYVQIKYICHDDYSKLPY